MGYCWYCYWGWAKEVVEVYNRALADLDDNDSPLAFGPSHVVWSDENWGDSSIDYCLKICDEEDWSERFSPEDIAIVRRSLVALRAIPESVRDCAPADYDDEHPENFPPKPGTVVPRPS